MQPVDVSRPGDTNKSPCESWKPIISKLGEQNLDGRSKSRRGWIAGVGDISCPVADLRHTSAHNGIPMIQDYNSKSISTYSRFEKTEQKRAGPSVCPHQPYTKGTKRSALQRHCDFWDADQDGLIYPWDIFLGFRKLGFNIALCLWAAVTMCMCSSYSTQTSWLPHPMLAINLDRIDCCRHGSTTGTYDMDAELDENRFEAIFRKYAEGKDYLTWRTMYNVWRGQCCANDFFGWFAGGLECTFCDILIQIFAHMILMYSRDCNVHITLAKGRAATERGYPRRV